MNIKVEDNRKLRHLYRWVVGKYITAKFLRKRKKPYFACLTFLFHKIISVLFKFGKDDLETYATTVTVWKTVLMLKKQLWEVIQRKPKMNNQEILV